ncbi:hypothetical protein [Paraburkholderia sp. HD33-4]|uniref:hypothetical protein n=1 Tax=Paraburkholderia sp. HD33-4 TaxID=2883242 RepID=UPI001F485062|nr:hypothetical protein [Paraburkholderia sp. HD33-4]
MSERHRAWVLLVGALLFGQTEHSAAQIPVPASSQNPNSNANLAQATAGVPVIVDARNKVVGPAFADGVILSVQGVYAYADLAQTPDSTNYFPASLYWGTGYGEVFPTTDCSGPPIIPAAQGLGRSLNPFRPAVVVRNGSAATLYIAGTSAATNQQYQGYGTGPSSCTNAYGTVAGYSVGITVDLNQTYPEPLHVK